MIYTTGVCYHCTLEERKGYRQAVLKAFKNKYNLKEGDYGYMNELQKYMTSFSDNADIEKNSDIAKNEALVENIFMMVICIELKIPLFLVGKPGSSKSLSKTIVNNVMQGKRATKEFYRSFKQIQTLSFQCSPHTTTESIFKVFQHAASYQKGKNLDEFTSVVILDEIGLAEDSETMPLKSLHPLLEQGYVEEGAEGTDKNKVAFVGISNWALDPAKMNRGVLVNRPVPKKQELLDCAKSICRSKSAKSESVAPLIEPLTNGYLKITENRVGVELREDYFGLRDFYSLLKMIHRDEATTWSKVRYCIQRNFAEKGNNCMQLFKSEFSKRNLFAGMYEKPPDTVALVRDNLKEHFTYSHKLSSSEVTVDENQSNSESRYLLLMTNNFTALQLIPELFDVSNCEVIFGSSFPQDQVYIQACRNINQIKQCMETGKNLILINLSLIYESLYDLLNQYYFFYGEKRYVDLGLGSDRVKCSVAPTFRLALIEEEKTALQFPIPLLNRMEKHFLDINSTLDENQLKIKNLLQQRMENFSAATRVDRTKKFMVEDVFVGYHSDTLSFSIKRLTSSNVVGNRDTDYDYLVNTAFKKVMQTCTLDALWRSTSQDAQSFGTEVYESRANLSDFLWHFIYHGDRLNKSLIEVSTFCRIPSAESIKGCNTNLLKKSSFQFCKPDQVQMVINLAESKTEHDFNNKVADFYQRAIKYPNVVKILFVTCAQMHQNSRMIICAKNCIQHMQEETKIPKLYTIFITQLPRNWYESSFTNFATVKWESFHIDDLDEHNETSGFLKEVYQNQDPMLIADIFKIDSSGKCNKFQKKLLQELVLECVADLEDDNKVELLNKVFRLFNKVSDSQVLLESFFMDKIEQMLRETKGSAQVVPFVRDAASNFQEILRMGTVEQVFFENLKEYAKPCAQDFLKTINFKVSLNFLSDNSWKKKTWIEMFCMTGNSIQTKSNENETILGEAFPFFGEIIKAFYTCWEEAVEIYQDDKVTTDQLFLTRFEKQNPELTRLLNELSGIGDAIKCFAFDLINESFIKKNDLFNDHIDVVKETILQISKGDRHLVFLNIFLRFQELLPALEGLLPIYQTFEPISKRVFKTQDIFSVQTFVGSFLDTVLNQITISREDFQSEVGWGRIAEQTEKVAVVKMCINNEVNLNEEFERKLRRIDLSTTFLYRMSFSLDSSVVNKVFENAWNVFQDANIDTNLLAALDSCLQSSAKTFTELCINKEIGTDLCGVCGIPVTEKTCYPPCLSLCTGKHLAHKECLSKGINEPCFICGTTMNCLPKNVKYFECQTPKLARSWKQFWQNVASTVVLFATQYIISDANEANVAHLCQFCVTKSENSWISKEICSCLLSVIIMKLQNNGISLIKKSIEKSSNKLIDTQELEEILMSSFDYCYANGCINQIPEKEAQHVTGKVQFTSYCKSKLRRLIEKIGQNEDANKNSTKNEITQLFKLLPKSKKVAAEFKENVQKYFVRYVHLKMGFSGLNELLQNQMFKPLIPPSIYDLKDLSDDIFLSYSGYLETMRSVNIELENRSSQSALQLLHQKPQMLQRIFSYRFIIDANSSQYVAPQAAQFRLFLQNQQNLFPHRQNSVRPPQNVAANNSLEHFTYFFQTFVETILQGKNNNLFAPFRVLLFDKNRCDSSFLPSFPDSYDYFIKMYIKNGWLTNDQLQTATLNECPNGHLYIIENCGRPAAQSKCAKCSAIIGAVSYNVFAPGNNQIARLREPGSLTNKRKFTGYMSEHTPNVLYRNCSEFTANLMQFFLHVTLYISTGQSQMLSKASENLTNMATSAFELCTEECLKIMVHLVEESSKFETGTQWDQAFVSEEKRASWEDAFASFAHTNMSTKAIQTVIQNHNRADAARNENRKSDKLNAILFPQDSTSSEEVQIFDAWRALKIETKESFEAKLHLRPENQNPLLRAVLTNDKFLESIGHISKLYHLFSKVTELYNSEETGRNQSFEKFFANKELSQAERRKLSSECDLFVNIWNHIMRKIPSTEGVQCRFRDEISKTSSVKYFTITEPVNENCAFTTFKFLTQKNNEIVEAYHQSLPVKTRYDGACASVVFSKGGHKIMRSRSNRNKEGSVMCRRT